MQREIQIFASINMRNITIIHYSTWQSSGPVEDPVGPGGRAALLAGVPGVGAGVVLVGRPELDRVLAKTSARKKV